jgi:hypothetical protein
MLTPDYDPAVGKARSYRYNWLRYFFDDGVLTDEQLRVTYRDRAMGTMQQHPLDPDSLQDFALAALGNYYWDGKHRRFFHQRYAMNVELVGGTGALLASRDERADPRNGDAARPA